MPTTRTRKIDVIHTLLRAGDMRRLRRTLARLDAVQVAGQLDNLDAELQIRAMRAISAERRADVLGAMRYEAAAHLVERLAPEEAAELVDELDADDAVDILGRLDEDKLVQILKRLDKEDADEIEELLAYDEETAGGLMSPEYFSVSRDATIAETLAALQDAEEVPETAFYVYVVDESERLLGVCSLQAIVTGRPSQPISEVMTTDVQSVPADMDQEDVAELVTRYDVVAVPVVDAHQHLVGVIAVDDVIDVIREEATEDILKYAGAGEELADSRSFINGLKARWRWLMAAAVGGMLVALSLSSFEMALASVPPLALFMPVVAGMGGNVGMQSSTIVVRGLAVGYVESSRVRRLILREVSIGASLGLIYGALIATTVIWVGGDADPIRLGTTVALGTAASTTIAALVGTCTPLVLDRLDIDPAIATGPFVTTSVDVLGLLVYFSLATVLLGIGG